MTYKALPLINSFGTQPIQTQNSDINILFNLASMTSYDFSSANSFDYVLGHTSSQWPSALSPSDSRTQPIFDEPFHTDAMQLAYASGPSAVTNSSCQTGMYHPNISDYSWDDPALFLSAGPSWSDHITYDSNLPSVSPEYGIVGASTSLAGTLDADGGYGSPSTWNGMFMGDGSPPDSPYPFHFPDQVDADSQLTFKSSLKNNNSKILGHQLPGTFATNGCIPTFALATSSPEVPWELLAAIWTAYCDTASAQQLPSPNHEACTRTAHSTRTYPLDVETDQGTKSCRSYLSKSVKPGSGPYQAVSEARRKKISTRGDTTISSDAHLDNAGQGVGPHRNDRRSRTSKCKSDHEPPRRYIEAQEDWNLSLDQQGISGGV
ncbi:hypothetical protein HWV62_15140 [Athelia sp. TMB]|nr:hypothetical protein HWV62_15140 [Athelia sp. TMB]